MPERQHNMRDALRFPKGMPATSWLFLAGLTLMLNTVQAALPGVWHSRNPGPTGASLNSVVWANGLFVASGTDGSVITSPDSTNWTRRPTGLKYLSEVIHDGSSFLAIGARGNVARSSDGIKWASYSSGVTNDLYDAAFGGGKYVLVGEGGAILVSTNATTWQAVDSGVKTIIWQVIHGNGRFLATAGAGSTNLLLTSTNGIQWQPVNPDFGEVWTGIVGWQKLTFKNDKFVALLNWPRMLGHSTDGIHWSTTPIPSRVSSHETLAVAGDYFVLLYYPYSGSQRYVPYAISTNATTWTPGKLPVEPDRRLGNPYENPNLLTSAAYGGGRYVLVGDLGEIQNAESPLNFSLLPRANQPDLKAIVFGGDRFVAVGRAGAVALSSDGVKWDFLQTDVTNHLNGIAFNGSKYVAVGSAGLALISTDSQTWQTNATPTTNDLVAIACGNNVFTAVDSAGNVVTSPDGKAWRRVNGVVTPYARSVAFGNGKFAIAASRYDLSTVKPNSTIAVSTNGIDWVTRRHPETLMVRIDFQNGRFFTTGNKFAWSIDALNWTTIEFVSYGDAGITYGNGKYVLIGHSSNIAAADVTDMIWDWETGYYPWNGLAFGKDTFVVVGDKGIIFQSDPIPKPLLAATLSIRTQPRFELSIAGTPGSACRLEYSDDLASGGWQLKTNFTLTNGQFVYGDIETATRGKGFYRAVTVP